MITPSLFTALGAALAQIHSVLATGCWRDTSCTGPTAAAFPGSWDKYIYSPSTRSVSPIAILSSNGDTLSAYPGAAKLNGNGSVLTFDFGKEVGGIVTVEYSAQGSGSLGLAFTEAKNWTGEWSDDSNGSFNPDGALYANVTTTSDTNYTMPTPKLRGGFRYLTLFTETTSNLSVSITDIVLEISYAPAWGNLQAYQGYFSSSDDLLNRIWYAGAYTLQTNSVPPSTGRAWPILDSGWLNDDEMDLGTSDPTIYVDGSKRDRTVWAGDLGIAVPSILKSTGDIDGVRNTLQVLWNDQSSGGELPFAGPPINFYGSDTYHMAVMIGTYEYFLFTNDEAFLGGIYSKYLAAMSFIASKIDSTGMLDVTGTNDWGRLSQGGHNTEANMLLYKVLTSGSQIATWQGDNSSAEDWAGLATTLKVAVNANNYDSAAGAFKDSDTDGSIHPEDGNSMALVFSVANDSYVSSISQQLTTNWIAIGAVCPELPDNLVGFVQSFEIKGHLAARQSTRALDLIRRAWGWYLNNPYGTESTCIEGYLADGSFGYRATTGYDNDYSYTSHSHGWSTGPTDALTSYVVGMTLTQPGGSQWQLAPQFGDLTHAEGGFTTPLGKFSANWALIQGGYTLSWVTPSGTTGVLILPGASGSKAQPSVELDGKSRASKPGDYDSATGLMTINATGGSHTARIVFG